jgi:hypothetical protein
VKIIAVEQRTQEWFQARAGIPTASELDNLVSPTWEIRKGETPKTYLARKLAERWLGYPLQSFGGSGATEQGSIKEEEAIPALEFEYDWKIQRVGFVTTDDGRVGCSPDGLLLDGGIEVKCPEAHTHVKYLLASDLPKDYATQVQGSMFVTGAEWWKFLSYCRSMPKLLLTIERDPKAQAVLAEALAEFNANLDAKYARLCEINGGPPHRAPTLAEQKGEWDLELATIM